VEFGDSRHDRQSESGARRLGGIERQEDLVSHNRVHPWPAVADLEEDLVGASFRRQGDRALFGATRVRRRLGGVAKKVREGAA
jgi:hypothetical protein